MENNSAPSAQAQLDSLAASRELALSRLFLPWPYVIGWALVMNVPLLSVVAPIVMSDDWVLGIQAGVFAGAIALAALQRNRHTTVLRPLLHFRGAWIVTAVCAVGLGFALALGIFASLHDDPWLGVAALAINFAALLISYGGLGFLFRREVARRT